MLIVLCLTITHLVVETPQPNLVGGMAWLQSTYTIRLNHRHKLFGHVFSGRYKAQIVEGSGNGYLKTACDYVHLNPVRARMLKPEERLLAFPWSSLGGYLAAPEHRPSWIRVDRLLGEHGLQEDTAAVRQQFEQRMEQRRWEETDPEALKALQRGWCLGSDAFKRQMLAKMEGNLGQHHSGELHRQSADAKAERIMVEELQQRQWQEVDLVRLRKKSSRQARDCCSTAAGDHAAAQSHRRAGGLRHIESRQRQAPPAYVGWVQERACARPTPGTTWDLRNE